MKKNTIAFEGCDGAGKSTLCRQFSNFVSSYGINNKIISFPTQEARKLLSQIDVLSKDEQIIVINIFLDDYEDVINEISSDDDCIYIFDRSPLSCLVYQQSVNPNNRHYIYSQIQKIEMPKVMVLLNVSEDVANDRIRKRNLELNIDNDDFEKRGLKDYIAKYQYEFENINSKKFHIDSDRWLDNIRNQNIVFQELLKTVQQ